jgi:hypothetical protein
MYDHEDQITCSKCGIEWLVETPQPGFVETMSRLSGYICADCAGEDPAESIFPSRRADP